MALYAIGDPHLSFQTNKPMNIFGSAWDDHPQKLRDGFLETVSAEDTVVLCGDLSWGMKLPQCRQDFAFLNALPGKTKLLLKGNHDYWWETAAKMERFFQQEQLDTFRILHNSCWFYGDTALCGTRGWFYELEQQGHDEKMLRRECLRLEHSLSLAGEREKIVFLHYPPLFPGFECAPILEILEKYQVTRCCYAHLHGRSCRQAVTGNRFGIEFELISADFLGFRPKKILD